MKDILRPILELLVVLPGLLLGYFPVKTYLKQSPGRLAAWLFPLMACLCIGSGLACYRLGASTFLALAGVALAAICLYTRTLTISLWKSGTIALSVCAVFACVNSLSRAVSAAIIRNQQLPTDEPWLCLGACVFYNAVCWVIVLAAYYPATHAVRAMVEDDNFAQTWYVFWVLPLAFILLNLFMIPRYQSTLQTGRVLQGYIVLSSALLVFMFCFLAKSQEMRAVGKAAIVPVCFAVNEPLLFAAPIVLNPVFFVPFVFAPIANIWILKIFIDFLGMNGFMYTLPWTVPGPIGTIMGLGFQPLAFVMLALILVVDFVLYYPFFRAYDAQKCAEEAEISQEELAAKNAEKAAKLNDAFQGKADAKSVAAGAAAEAVKVDSPAASAVPAAEATTASDLNGKRVLVLCQGGGTSGLLANALAKAAKERGINLETAAEAYGNHVDMLPDFDLVVLAPQAASYLADLQKDCERVGNKCVACRGKQYIELSQNGDKSLAFVSEQLSK